MLCGFNDDLAGQATASPNRVLCLVTQPGPPGTGTGRRHRHRGVVQQQPCATLRQPRTAGQELLTQIELPVEAHPHHRHPVLQKGQQQPQTRLLPLRFHRLARFAFTGPRRTLRSRRTTSQPASIAVAWPRCDMLFTFFRDGTFHEAPALKTAQHINPALQRRQRADTCRQPLPPAQERFADIMRGERSYRMVNKVRCRPPFRTPSIRAAQGSWGPLPVCERLDHRARPPAPMQAVRQVLDPSPTGGFNAVETLPWHTPIAAELHCARTPQRGGRGSAAKIPRNSGYCVYAVGCSLFQRGQAPEQ